MAKVLIVDDSETLRVQLRAELENAGHSVLEAADGMQGLQVLESNLDTELMITDVNMPRMGGIEMCKIASDDPRFKAIPKLMLTTDSDKGLKAQGAQAGVIAWIIKPYQAERLLAAIQKVLTMKKETP